MPTILVADDNSNIQKMVTLAFKDEGIDVITVGNGEAAIKKAAEVMPDLVLADIFMPVRGGYEVCGYLKQNTRFAHIPVVLLAGAFDPFDEREAQRVGADGVLKKPFVPPDPLVNLVKELLAKSHSSSLVSVAAPTQSAVSSEARTIEPSTGAHLHLEKPSIREIAPEFSSEMDAEPVVKDFSLTPSQVGSGNEGGSDPFGAMLASHVENHAESLLQPPAEKDYSQHEPAKAIDSFPSWMDKPVASDLPVPGLEDLGLMKPTPAIRSASDKLPGRGWAIEPAGSTSLEEETIVEPLERFFPSGLSDPIQPALEIKSETVLASPAAPVTAFSIGGTDHEIPDKTAKPTNDWTEIAQLTSSAEPDKSIKDWKPSFPVAPAQGAQILDPIEESVPSWRSFTPVAGPPSSAVKEDVQEPISVSENSHTAQETEFVQESLSANESSATEEKPFAVESSFPEHVPAPLVETPSEPAPESYTAAEITPPATVEPQATAEIAPSIPGHVAANFASEPAIDETKWQEMEATSIEAARAILKQDDVPTALKQEDAPAAQATPVPSPAQSPMDTKEVEDMVTRVVERMQPKILEVISREVLRPLVEALVRRQLEEK